MSIKLQLPKVTELRPRITVIGVGGAGGNAVNNMIAAGLTGVDFVVANTDAQALLASSAEHRIQLGANLTEGLGAGSKPEIGEAAAEEAIEEIRARVAGSHMVFVAAGMGGGTGTGAAAVIARVAKEEGVLVVGIVTKPFQFEGARRMRTAEVGIAELKKHVDTLIVIPNQNLFRVANEKTTFAEAFVLADQVLYSGISCIVDLIVKEGLINLDFADVRTILSGMGSAMMGTGEASGDRRAILAAEEAITNPLLDEVSLKGAKGLLLSIIGGRNLTLYEVDEAASRVRQEVDPEANIIVGATFDESLGDRVRVSIVASGMARAGSAAMPPPLPQSAEPGKPQTQLAPQLSSIDPRAAQRRPAGPPPGLDMGVLAPRSASGRADQPAATRSAPAPGYDDQSELSHRLSAAMGPGEPAVPAESDYDSIPDPNSTIAGPPWHAPGDVYIEEGLPQLTPAPVAGQARPPQPAAGPGGQPYPAFAPQPPSEVKRREPRRMPELEEFPAVGQRDYRAKTQAQGGVPSATGPGPRPGPPPAARQEPPRKPGFFERLTGRSRRTEPPAPTRDSSPRDSVAPRPASPPAPQPQRIQSPPRPQAPQRPPAGQERPPQKRVSAGGQPAELPIFFGKDGK